MTTKDELLNHNYDGIQEFDNPIPGWWHALWFGTMLFSIVYYFFFHLSPLGWSVEEAYDQDVAAFFEAQFAKFGDLNADEATIMGLSQNVNYMNAIAGTYQSRCASCHGKSGEGLVGPNLTDDAFIEVAQVVDIYDTIANGRVLKGMPAWSRQLQQTQLVLLSAYVAQLRGQNVPGSPPEGNVIAPWPTDYPRLDFDTSAEGGEGA